MPLKRSWVASANSADCPFPLNNLPYGVFSTDDLDARCGVAIGDMILDCQAAEEAQLLEFGDAVVFFTPDWNEVMDEGPALWKALRARLTEILEALVHAEDLPEV